MFVSPHALTSRAVWPITEKGWSSDFPPLPSAFSGKYPMAFMLRSHNGVAKCTFTGDSFQNHNAKVQQRNEMRNIFEEKLAKSAFLQMNVCNFGNFHQKIDYFCSRI